MNAIHLNLLNQADQQAPKDERKRIFSTVVSSLILLLAAAWAGFVFLQKSFCFDSLQKIKAEISSYDREAKECNALRARFCDQTAESDQQTFYLHSVVPRGELLKRLAYAIPEGVTLSGLSIPPPPDQGLKRPAGSKLPALQAPTGTVESVELRLTGLAVREQDVFLLMQALEGESFTGLVSIVKNPAKNERESPRVLAFRQEAPAVGHRNVFFDIVYDLKPREFVK